MQKIDDFISKISNSNIHQYFANKLLIDFMKPILFFMKSSVQHCPKKICAFAFQGLAIYYPLNLK